MCVYACIKRSHRHVTDPVVRVIVYWITEKYRCCTYISGTYTVLLYKEAGHLKSQTRQRLANTKSGTFSNWRNQYWRAQENIFGFLTIVFHWHHIFLVLLLFCFFFSPPINWSWNQAKSTSCCPLYAHSSHGKRWWLFLRQLHRLVSYEQLTNHKKPHR